jgi:putative DNA primase/helicase
LPKSQWKQVNQALAKLHGVAPPLIEQKEEKTGGRPVTRYYLYGKK